MSAAAEITLADGPAATAVTFHGGDASATIWVDPLGHVRLSPQLVRVLAEHVTFYDRAEAEHVDELAERRAGS